MAIHLTPTELAREAGMERREVIEKCMQWACRSSRAESTRRCSWRTSTEHSSAGSARRELRRVARAPRIGSLLW